jgi:dienelactone hydrolase
MSEHSGVMGAIGPLMPMHAGFDEAASSDAWARVLTFFGEHLAAGSGNEAGPAQA